MAKRASNDAASRGPSRVWIRPVVHAIFAAALAILALSSLARFEQFVINDWRFMLMGPNEGIAPANVAIAGIRYASSRQIMGAFESDFGRSLYLCPIAERRRNLLAVDWVKEASVSRVWPNNLIVRIEERKPVAFVEVAGHAGAFRGALVDSEGVLLDPKRAVNLKLPLLVGLPGNETEMKRRDRIRLFLRMQEDIGPLMEKISEIDASEVDNLKVTHVIHGRALLLYLGNQKFRQRLETFLRYYPEIQRNQPGATIFDLRVKNRILVVAKVHKPAASARTADRKFPREAA